MNCKPGDLAVIVRSVVRPEAVGAVVRCVAFMPAPDGRAAWLIDRSLGGPIVTEMGLHQGDWWVDANMRPIRDNDGEDETLSWAGKPQHIEA